MSKNLTNESIRTLASNKWKVNLYMNGMKLNKLKNEYASSAGTDALNRVPVRFVRGVNNNVMETKE